MADPADLTTLAAVKAYGGFSGTPADAVLSALITSASVMVQNWLDRTIAKASYTYTTNGNGAGYMKLPQWPIVSISLLKIDGVTIPASSGYGSAGYQIDDDQVHLLGYDFTRGRRNVQVAYEAGYDAVPADIAQAVNELVARRYKERDWLGYQSKSLAGETVAFATSAMSDTTKTSLGPYRKVTPT